MAQITKLPAPVDIFGPIFSCLYLDGKFTGANSQVYYYNSKCTNIGLKQSCAYLNVVRQLKINDTLGPGMSQAAILKNTGK
jgi:hypothetical protein